MKKFSESSEVRSAGTVVPADKEKTKIGDKPNNEVQILIEVMEEDGIDLKEKERKALTPKIVDWADKIVCMAQRETIPDYLLQSGKMEYWSVEDAVVGSDYDFFVESRERIKKKVEKLAKEIEIAA